MSSDLAKRLNAHSSTVPKGQLRDDLRTAADALERLSTWNTRAQPAGMEEALERLRFNVDFQRGYGSDDIRMSRADGDLLLAALTSSDSTVKGESACEHGIGSETLCSQCEANSIEAGSDDTTTDTADRYFITKGGAYYRPNAEGYTRDTFEAGRFTLDEAVAHSHPNGPDGPRDGIDYIVAPTPASHAAPDALREALDELIRVGCNSQFDDAEMRAALRKAMDVRTGPLPEGYVAVPVEPTNCMVIAGAGAVAPNIVDCPDDADPAEVQMRDHVLTEAAQTYRAMIAARPTGES